MVDPPVTVVVPGVIPVIFPEPEAEITLAFALATDIEKVACLPFLEKVKLDGADIEQEIGVAAGDAAGEAEGDADGLADGLAVGLAYGDALGVGE